MGLKGCLGWGGVIGSLLVGGFGAAQADTSFERAQPYSNGAVNVEMPKGQYVYKTPTPDSRMPMRPFMVGKPPRQDYVFFSSHEKNALLYLIDKAEEKHEQEQAAARQALARAHVKVAWPRVIVRGEEVCVPELRHSDAADWTKHLTCWSDRSPTAGKGEGS